MEGGLGFEAGNGNGPGTDKEKGEGRVKGRHGSRRWSARGTEAGVDRRRATRAARGAERSRGRERVADKWAPRANFYFLFSFFFRAVTAGLSLPLCLAILSHLLSPAPRSPRRSHAAPSIGAELQPPAESAADRPCPVDSSDREYNRAIADLPNPSPQLTVRRSTAPSAPPCRHPRSPRRRFDLPPPARPTLTPCPWSSPTMSPIPRDRRPSSPRATASSHRRA